MRRNMSVGDLVLIVDAPRGQWKLGRIHEVKCDDKGFVRSAQIQTQHGTLMRPISKMIIYIYIYSLFALTVPHRVMEKKRTGK